MEPFWEVSLKYIDQLSIWSGTFVSYFFLISVLITSYEVFVDASKATPLAKKAYDSHVAFMKRLGLL